MAQRGVTVIHTDFPLYTIRMLGDRHFLIAGGGGQAKTGIANAIEIFELKHESGSCIATKINHYETGSEAVMNCSAIEDEKSFVIATGQEGNSQLYTLRFKVVAVKEGQDASSPEGVRKRKGNQTKSEEYDKAQKTIVFDIEKGSSIQTDFHKDGPFQKVSVFTQAKDMFTTGGADGCIRVWKYPSLEKIQDIKAHTNEIDDLDINHQGKRIVSISKDNHGYIWNTKDGKKVCELKWTHQSDVAYRFRNCRFGTVVDRKDVYNLYTSHIPSTRGAGGGRKSPHCYITKWSTVDFTPTRKQDVGTETLSAMGISSDGVYLATGTISGSVSVYISFSLQRLYHMREVHGIFVTGLEFAPQEASTKAITGNHDFTLFSISADNQVKMHQEASRMTFSAFWVLVGFVIILYLIFWLLSTYL